MSLTSDVPLLAGVPAPVQRRARTRFKVRDLAAIPLDLVELEANPPNPFWKCGVVA